MTNVILGVNIDHIATLRNARGTVYPDPFDAISLVAQGGGHGITIHLREDRRHIIDSDVQRICEAKPLPVNLEMAATEEMLAIAIANQPAEVCLVPEKRAELTTEGGLDVLSQQNYLKDYIAELQRADILVSLFIDPEPQQIQASVDCGADIVELHTGQYAELESDSSAFHKELQRLKHAAEYAHAAGLVVNAGHGLTIDNVSDIAQLPYMHCLNIGHSIIARAVFVGLQKAVQEMTEKIQS